MTTPDCPVCQRPLVLGARDGTDRWSCPAGCGLALTLSEAHGHLQDDELADLWQRARRAAPGPLASPFGGRPMARFELPVDADEVPAGAPGGGPVTSTVTLDVDVDEQFVWFDAGELEEFPADLADAGPTAEQLAAEERIRRDFGAALDAAALERGSHQLTERLYRRVARHPGALGALDRLGRAVTSY